MIDLLQSALSPPWGILTVAASDSLLFLTNAGSYTGLLASCSSPAAATNHHFNLQKRRCEYVAGCCVPLHLGSRSGSSIPFSSSHAPVIFFSGHHGRAGGSPGIQPPASLAADERVILQGLAFPLDPCISRITHRLGSTAGWSSVPSSSSVRTALGTTSAGSLSIFRTNLNFPWTSCVTYFTLNNVISHVCWQ